MSLNKLCHIQNGIDAKLEIGCIDLQATGNITSDTVTANDIKVDTIDVDGISTDILTLNNQLSVPNPTVGSMALFTDPSGILNATDPLGTTVQYATVPPAGAYVVGTAPSVVGNFPAFSSVNADAVVDSGFSSTDITNKLPLAGGTMAGGIDMAGFMLSNLNNVSAVAGFVNFQDGIDVSSHVITSVSNVNFSTGVALNNSSANGGVAIGGSANAGNNASVSVGNSANASGNGAMALGNSSICSVNNSLAVGLSSNNSGVGGIALGRNTLNSGTNGTAIGTSANCSSQDSICIGSASAASVSASIAIGSGANSSAAEAHVFGNGTSNSVANSVLFGNNLLNMRPNNNGVCDLGQSANKFNSAYLMALRLPQAANGTSGVGAVLVAGTVTVNTTAVSTGDVVLLSRTANAGSPGWAAVTAIVNGVSFTITSSDAGDTSTFSWVIIKQA